MEHLEKKQSLFLKVELDEEEKPQKSNKRWAVLSISSIPLVMTLGNSMLIPVLPAMESELKITSFQTSMIITLYSIVAIILIPVAGLLSDHIGRKKVIIPCLTVAAIGGLISAWASWKVQDPYWLVLLGRALQGVGASGAAPIVMPLVGDMFKSEKEVSSSLGLIETSNTLGKVLSPILGAYLAGFVWFLPFFSIPVFCLLSIVLVLFLVKTPKKREKPIPFRQFLQAIKEIFRNNWKWLSGVFFIGVILMFVLFAVLFYLSDVLEKIYHIKNIKKGLYLAIPLGGLCFSSYITGKMIKENKILMKWITLIGILILAASVGILNLSNNLWFVVSLFLGCGIGIGVGLPCLDAFVTEGIEKKERGTISAIYSSMRFIGVALGPPFMAIMMKHAEDYLFFILCGLSVLAALITLFTIRPEKEAA